MWWHTAINPELGRLRQNFREFEAILGYICSKIFSQDENKVVVE